MLDAADGAATSIVVVRLFRDIFDAPLIVDTVGRLLQKVDGRKDPGEQNVFAICSE